MHLLFQTNNKFSRRNLPKRSFCGAAEFITIYNYAMKHKGRE